jgi:hypothetical protein
LIALTDKAKYLRKFLIFEEEDRGYGASGKPSGYVKIEIKGGTGTLSAMAENIKPDNRITYRLYAIKAKEANIELASAGNLNITGTCGNLMFKFNPLNIAGSGISLDDISLFAICALHDNGKAAWPLCAYLKGRTEWRSRLGNKPADRGNLGVTAKENATEEFPRDVVSKYKVDITSIYDKERMQEINADGIITARPDTAKSEGNKFGKKTAKSESPLARDEKTKAWEHESPLAGDAEVKARQPEPLLDVPEKAEAQSGEIYGKTQLAESRQTEAKQPEEELLPGNGEKEQSKEGLEPGAQMARLPSDEDEKVESETERISTQGIACSHEADPLKCANCYLHGFKKAKSDEKAVPADMKKLREAFDVYFERHCPFNNRRKDYTWWKVNSPVYLNNVLYQFDIKAPVLFNPKALMAHFKYRHYIAGIYTDKRTEKEYLVCGVPGAYRMDEKPFGGDICRWVQSEGTQLRYGAFGYWLVYIDPETGQVLGS